MLPRRQVMRLCAVGVAVAVTVVAAVLAGVQQWVLTAVLAGVSAAVTGIVTRSVDHAVMRGGRARPPHKQEAPITVTSTQSPGIRGYIGPCRRPRNTGAIPPTWCSSIRPTSI